MNKVVLVILACFGLATNAAALEDYIGFSLNAAKSSENGIDNSSGGIAAMISARPNQYYGYEVQAGMFGRAGPFSSNGEADFSVAGFLPLADSGIDVYGKVGVDSVYSTGNLFKTGFTYGAGVEYLRGKGGVRFGFQHFDVGNATQSPSLSTRLIGMTFMLKLDK